MKIEKDIGSINEFLLGKEGLYVSFAEQREITKQQGENIDKLINGIEVVNNAMIRTDAETKLITRLGKERKTYQQWLIGLVITVSLSLLTASFTLGKAYLDKNEKPKTEQVTDE